MGRQVAVASFFRLVANVIKQYSSLHLYIPKSLKIVLQTTGLYVQHGSSSGPLSSVVTCPAASASLAMGSETSELEVGLQRAWRCCAVSPAGGGRG